MTFNRCKYSDCVVLHDDDDAVIMYEDDYKEFEKFIEKETDWTKGITTG